MLKRKAYEKLEQWKAEKRQKAEQIFSGSLDAGIALPCYNVVEPQPPLQLNAKHNLFKLFMEDTGLLCAVCMENVQLSGL